MTAHPHLTIDYGRADIDRRMRLLETAQGDLTRAMELESWVQTGCPLGIAVTISRAAAHNPGGSHVAPPERLTREQLIDDEAPAGALKAGYIDDGGSHAGLLASAEVARVAPPASADALDRIAGREGR